MPRYHCSIPKTAKAPAFNFTAFQEGKQEVPDAAPVALLERRAGPEFREYDRESTVEVVPPDGGPSKIERVRTRVRERVSQLAQGRAVIRNVLEVEAISEAEAEAIYRKSVGINSEGTSRQIHVVLVDGAEVPSAPAAPKGNGKHKPTAEESARALVGGKVSLED